jgi:perosamine synthetase
LAKLPASVARRQAIARQYDEALCQLPAVKPLAVRNDVSHAYHLYVIRLEIDAWTADRATIFRALRAEGIGVNVHYLPVHLHPYYRHKFGTGEGLCPVAEAAYERLLSLPMFPAMTNDDVRDVVEAIDKVWQVYQQ